MRKLTPKQQRFVEEYLIDLNATAAYGRAGYEAKGTTARVNASRLLTNANVAQAIQEAKEARSERTQITADRVLLEYARLGFSDMREFTEWGPWGVTWKPSQDLSEDAAACVAEVSETVSEEGGTRRFKLHSKTAALKDLAQHLGLLGKDGVNVSVNIDNRREAEEAEEQFEKLFSEIDDYRADEETDAVSGGADKGQPLDPASAHDSTA